MTVKALFIWIWLLSLSLSMPVVEAQDEAVMEEGAGEPPVETTTTTPEEQNCLSPVALEECQAEVGRLNEEWNLKLSQAMEKVQAESLQAVQTLELEHAQALAVMEQEYQAAQTAAMEQAVAEALEKERKDMQVERETMKGQLAQALAQALQEQTDQHTRAYDLLQTKSQQTLAELKTCHAQEATLQAKHKSQTQELYQARRELLHAHEIVRLYELRFYNRWFFLPLTNALNKLYDSILQPLGHEIYLVAYPVLDPLNDFIVQPLQPHVQAAFQQLQVVLGHVGDALIKAWETTVAQVSAWMTYVVEEVPPAVIQFLAWAGPHVWKFLQSIQHACQQAYQTTNKFMATHVAPKWDEFVVQPVWVAHVLPWWAETQPILKHDWQSFQNAILPHWTEFVKVLNAQAHQNKVPEAIVEGTRYLARNPRASLEMAEILVASIVGLLLLSIVLRLLFSTKKATAKQVSNHEPSKKKHHGGKKHHAKQNGHYKTKSQ